MPLFSIIALSCFIISQGTIIIAYLIGIQYDHPMVETCNPYLQGCLNITDVGIFSPEGYVFRGGMITACAFFMMWWVSNYYIAQQTLGVRPKRLVWSSILGLIGSVLLIISTALLVPPRGDINWTLHVICATSFFLVTFFAQALDLWLCISKQHILAIEHKSLMAKKAAVAVQAIMIAVFLALEALGVGDNIRNAIEWWLALLIAVYFGSAYWDWKRISINVHR